MATTVSMPQLGETVTEGTILRWAKKVGDTIAEDEVLVEISTDKVDTEVPSPVAGTILEILVEEGDTVEVGVELVVIGDADESTDSSGGGEAAAQAEAEPEQAAAEAEAEPEQAEAEPEQAEKVEPETEDSDSGSGGTMTAAVAGELHPASETPEGADEGFAAGQTTATEELSDEEVEAFFAEPSSVEKEPHLLSPVVRKLIRENDVDISKISGTGQGG
ncbi:MAG TPA: biotin/lipoyl-containing protein, partial [Acidimicrobiia bacterium]|nr:biotin/lipoyl-containing protein [Acidimicrobiia bacterium]